MIRGFRVATGGLESPAEARRSFTPPGNAIPLANCNGRTNWTEHANPSGIQSLRALTGRRAPYMAAIPASLERIRSHSSCRTGTLKSEGENHTTVRGVARVVIPIASKAVNFLVWTLGQSGDRNKGPETVLAGQAGGQYLFEKRPRLHDRVAFPLERGGD